MLSLLILNIFTQLFYTSLASSAFDSKLAFKFYNVAAASYRPDNPQPCLSNGEAGFQLIGSALETKCDLSTSCAGIIVLSEKEKAIGIGFRGSDDTGQLVAELLGTLGSPKTPFAGGKVYKYFYDAFNGMYVNMTQTLENLLQQYPSFNVWITGHSLGGAMASLMATKLVIDNKIHPDNIKLITFGEPRVGSIKYAQAQDQLVPYSFRVVHARDVVPHLPPCLVFADKPSQCIEDPTQVFPYHHGVEIFYQNKTMTNINDYHICKKDEDENCSDGQLIDLNINDHLSYYGYQLTKWLDDDACKTQ